VTKACKKLGQNIYCVLLKGVGRKISRVEGGNGKEDRKIAKKKSKNSKKDRKITLLSPKGQKNSKKTEK